MVTINAKPARGRTGKSSAVVLSAQKLLSWKERQSLWAPSFFLPPYSVVPRKTHPCEKTQILTKSRKNVTDKNNIAFQLGVHFVRLLTRSIINKTIY